MKSVQNSIFSLIVFLVILNFNKSECVHRTKRFDANKTNRASFNLLLAPALMLTTSDSISFVYPKEMGYEKDFLHTIYRISNDFQNDTNKPSNTLYRIEDAVYDNQTWSIYFVVSNLTGGSEIYRLKHLNPFTIKQNFKNYKLNEHPSHGHFYQVAANWSRSLVYKNNTAKILSMDINVKKRKVYWFEFNKQNKKWSIAIKKLGAQMSIAYYNFDAYSEQNYFTNDGYNFMSIAQDNTLSSDHLVSKRLKIDETNDITAFISNNQTLNICFLLNMTCEDFFKAPVKPGITPIKVDIDIEAKSQVKDYNYEDEFVYDEESGLNNDPKESKSLEVMTNQVVSTVTTPQPPIFTFGRLMGIKYDSKENALYLADYGYDRIEKISFENNSKLKFKSIEPILKSENGQTPLNPIMSVFYDSYIFWIDFEEGLKVTVYKSSCVRSIYKIKEATTLKLIEIGTCNYENLKESYPSDAEFQTVDSSRFRVLNKLISLQANKFQYPPDYYFYYPNSYSSNRFELNSSANLTKVSKVQILFLFLTFFKLF